jgi:hypothetical protein
MGNKVNKFWGMVIDLVLPRLFRQENKVEIRWRMKFRAVIALEMLRLLINIVANAFVTLQNRFTHCFSVLESIQWHLHIRATPITKPRFLTSTCNIRTGHSPFIFHHNAKPFTPCHTSLFCYLTK